MGQSYNAAWDASRPYHGQSDNEYEARWKKPALIVKYQSGSMVFWYLCSNVPTRAPQGQQGLNMTESTLLTVKDP